MGCDCVNLRRGKRSGIVNDPYRPDDRQYNLCLIGKVITFSLETTESVAALLG